MKKAGLVLIALFFATAACSCTAPQNSNGRYSAEFAYDPQQYMLFINKELQTPLNQMSNILAAIGKFEKGELSRDTLCTLARRGQETVDACRQAIFAMHPPERYTENAEQIAGYLEDIEEHYIELMDLLEEETADTEAILSISDRLHEEYLLLTSEANTYWK